MGYRQKFRQQLMHMTKLCVLSLLIGAAVLLLWPAAQADAKANPRYAAIVIDADTGSILYQRYADKELHPASLAKMMTLMLTFDEIRRGNLRWGDKITISTRATQTVPSKLGLKRGDRIRVRDAVNILVTKSANDIAIALAEHIAGSETQFASMMTQRARAIGMTRTTFRNASGLHDRRQVTTARDMAILSRYLIRNYAQEYKYFGQEYFTYRGITYRNHNRLMRQYKGMDGLKTGYIRAAGFNLAASATRDGRRVIGIVFGGRTAKTRNAHMAKLLDLGFSRLNRYVGGTYASATIPVPSRKPAGQGEEGRTAMLLASAQNLNTIAPAVGGAMASVIAATPVSRVKRVDLHEMTPGIDWAAMKSVINREAYIDMIGQGDIDENMATRMGTGLLAMSALKSSQYRAAQGTISKASYNPATQKNDYRAAKLGKYRKRAASQGDWAIQIGAFNSRVQTDRAILDAKAKLPDALQHGVAAISPVKNRKSWLFRGRLYGYSRAQAAEACRMLKDCMAIAPKS
jgi:D-alanyl-D-alanine carboxypeptidase